MFRGAPVAFVCLLALVGLRAEQSTEQCRRQFHCTRHADGTAAVLRPRNRWIEAGSEILLTDNAADRGVSGQPWIPFGESACP
jgi:hypothetical protein